MVIIIKYWCDKCKKEIVPFINGLHKIRHLEEDEKHLCDKCYLARPKKNLEDSMNYCALCLINPRPSLNEPYCSECKE